MESRKLQKVGADTLTISLPKEWARRRNLKRGDRLFLVEEGEALKLLPPHAADERRRAAASCIVDADMCGAPGFLERVIVGNYVLGREKISIVSKRRLSGAHLQEVRRVVRRLMGIGIIEEHQSKVVLHSSIDATSHPIDVLIKRLYQLGATMLSEALESLDRGDPHLADEALNREDDSDMMYWLILRLVLSAQVDERIAERVGIRGRMEIPEYHLIARDLETVADHCAIIANSVKEIQAFGAKLPLSLKKAYLAQGELIGRMYVKALGGLLSLDLAQANEAILMATELARRDNDMIRMVVKEIREPRVVIPLRVISGRMARIGEYAVSIAVVAFNRYLVRSTPLCRAEPGDPG